MTIKGPIFVLLEHGWRNKVCPFLKNIMFINEVTYLLLCMVVIIEWM